MKISQFVLKILDRNEIVASIKCQNTSTNVRKMTCNNPKLELVNINAYLKFGKKNLSNCSQDIERKQNFGVSLRDTLVQISEKWCVTIQS